jgi:GTP-binding protein EngB required for normal cell division
MRTLLLIGLTIVMAGGQVRQEDEPRQRKLPDGRSQTEEIVKADHKKSLEDAAELVTLAEQLKGELEKNDRHVVSVSSIKKTEEIEKLARRIRSRLRRH